MATFTFEDEEIDEGEQQSGGALRKQLEETLKINRQLAARLAKADAVTLLADKGFTYVKPEDLEGVDPDKIEATAAKIQEERQALREEVLRDVLAGQGLEGDELTDRIADMAGTRDEDADAADRIRTVGRSEARSVPTINPEKLHGFDAIKAGIEANVGRRKVRT